MNPLDGRELWEAQTAENVALIERGVLVRSALAGIYHDPHTFRYAIQIMDLDITRTYVGTYPSMTELMTAWRSYGFGPISSDCVGRWMASEAGRT